MVNVICFMAGIMLGGLVGLIVGFVLGADYIQRQDAPIPDIFEEDDDE